MSSIRSYLLLFLTLVPVALSCTKSDVQSIDGRRAELTFVRTIGSGTAVGISEEASGSIDVFVFRDNGALESYSRGSGHVLTTEVASGRHYRYHVFADAPDGALADVVTEAQLNGKVWNLVDRSSGVVMTGCGDGRFDGDCSIEVGVDRLVSKVTLKDVTPKFLEQAFRESVVILKRVFLINVNGSCPYSASPACGSIWYNRLVMETLPADLKDCLVRELDVPLSGGNKVSCDVSFICCPNPVDNGVTSLTEPTWSERNTRLVIELDIDGEANYYHVNMPSMACNTSYVVKDAVLLGPGSSYPDVPVSRASIDFSISVNPWGKDADRNLNF